MPDFADQDLKCKDCPNTFVFSAGEQEWFADRGLTAPVRCKPCRQRRKAERDGVPGSVGVGVSFSSPNPNPRPVVVDAGPPPRRNGGGRRGGRRREDDAWGSDD